MSKVVFIVLDSLGIGAMPDAEAFHDCMTCNTLANVSQCHPAQNPFPHIKALGFLGLLSSSPVIQSQAYLAKLTEQSQGKDTVVGHWELCGVISDNPFPVYPEGFPPEVCALVANIFGKPPIGNIPVSGTTIINTLGEDHLATGAPILYTSSDSVLQIAYHEDLLAPALLHEKCAHIRQALMQGPHRVNRVIARPFIGKKNGDFTRTENRKDFTIPIPEANLLHDLLRHQIPVHAIGKIKDIFPNVPFTQAHRAKNNQEGIDAILKTLAQIDHGLIFANLVDFDMLYGHRRDCIGYAQALAAFDAQLPAIIAELNEKDLLVLTADHGCDPTTAGSDHTREYVPLVLYSPHWPEKDNAYLGIRPTFADCAATIASFFKIDDYRGAGTSVLSFTEMRGERHDL